MSSKRVIRGGSWSNGSWRLPSTSRDGYDTDNRYSYLGFRLIKQPVGKPNQNIVVHSGSWDNPARYCWSAPRGGTQPDLHIDVLGFRLINKREKV